jgi:hypothetical protein
MSVFIRVCGRSGRGHCRCPRPPPRGRGPVQQSNVVDKRITPSLSRRWLACCCRAQPCFFCCCATTATCSGRVRTQLAERRRQFDRRRAAAVACLVVTTVFPELNATVVTTVRRTGLGLAGVGVLAMSPGRSTASHVETASLDRDRRLRVFGYFRSARPASPRCVNVGRPEANIGDRSTYWPELHSAGSSWSILPWKNASSAWS